MSNWECLLLQSGDLAESVSKIIDSQLADGVDMSEVQVIWLFHKISSISWFTLSHFIIHGTVQDEFSAVITKALVTLVLGLETKFDNEMAGMTRVPWGSLESVGDQSE